MNKTNFYKQVDYVSNIDFIGEFKKNSNIKINFDIIEKNNLKINKKVLDIYQLEKKYDIEINFSRKFINYYKKNKKNILENLYIFLEIILWKLKNLSNFLDEDEYNNKIFSVLIDFNNIEIKLIDKEIWLKYEIKKTKDSFDSVFKDSLDILDLEKKDDIKKLELDLDKYTKIINYIDYFYESPNDLKFITQEIIVKYIYDFIIENIEFLEKDPMYSIFENNIKSFIVFTQNLVLNGITLDKEEYIKNDFKNDIDCLWDLIELRKEKINWYLDEYKN